MLINGNLDDYGQQMQRCKEYIEALEEERRKIQVFRRELPLCLELVNQAIEACKQQLSGSTTEKIQGQSECSEQTSTEGPVLEEFLPVKRASPPSSDDDDYKQQSKKPKNISCTSSQNEKNNDKSSTKSGWLGSAQLWNQTPDPPIKEDSLRKVSVTEVKRNGSGVGAFHPFKKVKNVASVVAAGLIEGSTSSAAPAATASSSDGTGGDNEGKKEEKEDKGGQCERKTRRCWSPELHKRFLQALQQLGGAHVATPKQIRELMKVDGLTNDEVKSHLQKYRLHTRRSSPSIHNNSNPQGPHFVVVGGIWVPPSEYAAAMTKTTTASGDDASEVRTTIGIYSPMATVQPPASLNQRQQHKALQNSNQRGSHSEGGFHSNSPSTTTSSTHTTTTSHAF